MKDRCVDEKRFGKRFHDDMVIEMDREFSGRSRRLSETFEDKFRSERYNRRMSLSFNMQAGIPSIPNFRMNGLLSGNRGGNNPENINDLINRNSISAMNHLKYNINALNAALGDLNSRFGAGIGNASGNLMNTNGGMIRSFGMQASSALNMPLGENTLTGIPAPLKQSSNLSHYRTGKFFHVNLVDLFSHTQTAQTRINIVRIKDEKREIRKRKELNGRGYIENDRISSGKWDCEELVKKGYNKFDDITI